MKLISSLFNNVYLYFKNRPRLDYLLLALGLMVFATIALLNASRASIWFDEAFSAYISQFSFWDIARYTAADVHPPLYYWLLKIWSSLFGTTEIAYRSLSLLFGLGAITTTFILTKKLFGRSVAAVSLLFLSLSPMLIRYSDEARMYTLASLIVMAATYVLVKVHATKNKKLWALYGLLVSLGMWTHYFTALAWLAHWAWWFMLKRQKSQGLTKNIKAMFTKEWVMSYAVAVGLFIPWAVVMLWQLGVVQGTGFWIGRVGTYTVGNYFSNMFYYLEQALVQPWAALLLIATLAVIIICTPRAYRSLNSTEKKWFRLFALLAWLPPVLLFLASLPPLRSSFVERYLIPAFVAAMVYFAVVLVVGTRHWKMRWRAVPILTIAGMMIFGITNVYEYGNYNKNSNTHILTRQVVEATRQTSYATAPIVAADPWVFYEAAPYETASQKVYFIDENTGYDYGSLMMLQDNSLHKITNLAQFKVENSLFWYFASTDKPEVQPYEKNWKPIQTVSVKSPITGSTSYKATLYSVN